MDYLYALYVKVKYVSNNKQSIVTLGFSSPRALGNKIIYTLASQSSLIIVNVDFCPSTVYCTDIFTVIESCALERNISV